MEAQKLINILENHRHWLNADCDGWKGMCADLRGANLENADLGRAILENANLVNTNLENAILEHANLRYADLRDADLRGANLLKADLRGADLNGAVLRGTYLKGANLSDETLQKILPICCPDYGSFIGWKKAGGYFGEPIIIKLRITEDARRSSATGRKCRCSKAIVLGFETIDGEKAEVNEIESNYDCNFLYRLGETVEVKDFDDCSSWWIRILFGEG